MRIELSRAILSPRLQDFVRNTAIHFHIFLFGDMFPESRCCAGHKLEQVRLIH